MDWKLRTRILPLGERTAILGIVNVTPDSFSDGGRYLDMDRAVDHGLFLLESGADILDIGGETTRPGSPAGTGNALPAEAEQARVLPVLQKLRRLRPEAILSVDTYRASTARLAVNAGAEIVNDVSGHLWDRAMGAACAELGCGVVLTHTRGLPSEWSTQPRLSAGEVLPLVGSGLQECLDRALMAGIAKESVVLDPGFGFGKRGDENWALLAGLSQLGHLGLPLLAAASRKGFLASQASEAAPAQRPSSLADIQTHAAHVAAILGGAHLIRVHDARGARAAADVADAVLAAIPQKA